MLNKTWFHFASGIALGLISLTAAAKEAAIIDALKGSVSVTRSGKAMTGQTSLPLIENDLICAGKASWVVLDMADGGSVTVRADSCVRIAIFRYDNKPSDKGVLDLLKGAIRTVTGAIGSKHPENYAVRTKTATVGVRGTDHDTVYIPEDDPANIWKLEPGTYDHVNAGETFIKPLDSQEIITVKPGEVGVATRNRAKAMINNIRLKIFKQMLAQDERNGASKRLAELHQNLGGGAFHLRDDWQQRRAAMHQRIQDRLRQLREKHGLSSSSSSSSETSQTAEPGTIPEVPAIPDIP